MTLLLKTAALGACLLLLTGCAAGPQEPSVSSNAAETIAPSADPVDEALTTVDITIPGQLA